MDGRKKIIEGCIGDCRAGNARWLEAASKAFSAAFEDLPGGCEVFPAAADTINTLYCIEAVVSCPIATEPTSRGFCGV